MGLFNLFNRKIKPGSNLTRIPTDRLLREYAETAGAFAVIAEMNARSEFSTPENPVFINGEAFSGALNAMLVHSEIRSELERRGLKPE